MLRVKPSGMAGRLGVRLFQALFCVGVALVLAGCHSYEMHGKVIAGADSAVLVVDRDDPRLDQPGIPGVVVRVTIDPDRGRGQTTSGISDMDGRFTVPVDVFAGGALDYESRVLARLAEHEPAMVTFRLPRSRQRVLIMLGPGVDRPPTDSQYFLDETMRMGEPYLR